ncbi:MAG TPA: hypothetical protein VFU41_11935 [Gemmatimonadales bacterium]|nr:hypothetical protein [Gemmatimonadales bacterium]
MTTVFRSTIVRATPFFLTALALSCGGDRSGSPTCGLAALAGPMLIQEQLKRQPFVLTDAPRGLPASLPARVAGTAQQGQVAVGYHGPRLTMAYGGPGAPPFPTDTTVYALLVVDDSTQRAQGVLIYEGVRPPETYPQLGVVTWADKSIPLYGVRVEWTSVSNPRCPLLGAPAQPS